MICLQLLCQDTEISKYLLSVPDLKTELLVREVGALPAASIHTVVQTMKHVSQIQFPKCRWHIFVWQCSTLGDANKEYDFLATTIFYIVATDFMS